MPGSEAADGIRFTQSRTDTDRQNISWSVRVKYKEGSMRIKRRLKSRDASTYQLPQKKEKNRPGRDL